MSELGKYILNSISECNASIRFLNRAMIRSARRSNLLAMTAGAVAYGALYISKKQADKIAMLENRISYLERGHKREE